MRRILAVVLPWLAAAAFLSAVAAASDADSDDEQPADLGDTTEVTLAETPEIPQHRAFGPGEYAQFSVRYGLVRAGDALLQVNGIRKVDGHDCYHLVSKAESNSFFDRVHKVRDRVDSYLDSSLFVSRRFEKHLREGNYRKDDVIEFHPESQTVTYEGQDPETLSTGPRALDVLAAFYYTRLLDLEVGQEYHIENHADRKNHPLRVKVHRREQIKVPAGTFDCLVVEPFLRSEGIFQQKGRLVIWLTDDARKLPVQMKSKTAIGWVSCVLTDYRVSKSPAH